MAFDGKAFGKDVVGVVKEYMEREVSPLLKRIEELEKRQPLHGQDGRDGTDGVGVAGALIDRSGVLVLTLSDGATKELGAVVGKDGSNGEDGRPGEKGDPGQDGKDGRDGLDGFGFDDLEVIHDGARGFKFQFVKGDRVKAFDFKLPVVLDRGVYKAGESYQTGDGVTWAGSFWIAQEDTTEKPDGGKGWRLAVKRGRDGKDGVVRAAPDGKPVKV